MEKIRWAPKVRQEKLWALYQSDARGLLDENLLMQVGYALLARCESIFQIEAGQTACPRCGAVFQVRPPLTQGSPEPVPCPTPGCGWEVSGVDYDVSIRHRELHIGQAGYAFRAYAEAFPQAKTPQARMFAIDRLIHAFHYDLKYHQPGRPAANNLIEGSIDQVVDLLDRLTFGGDPQTQVEWRENIDQMWRKRRGRT